VAPPLYVGWPAGSPLSSAIGDETHFCPVPRPRKTPSGGSPIKEKPSRLQRADPRSRRPRSAGRAAKARPRAGGPEKLASQVVICPHCGPPELSPSYAVMVAMARNPIVGPAR
jgi:hypothetical protein